MKTSTPPTGLRASNPINFGTPGTINKKSTSRKALNGSAKYPFSNGRNGHVQGVKDDHALSGGKELLTLLEGQQTIVKQRVFDRIAALQFVPQVAAVRTMIMQEAQRAA